MVNAIGNHLIQFFLILSKTKNWTIQKIIPIPPKYKKSINPIDSSLKLFFIQFFDNKLTCIKIQLRNNVYFYYTPISVYNSIKRNALNKNWYSILKFLYFSVTIRYMAMEHKTFNLDRFFFCTKCINPFKPFHIISKVFCCNTIKPIHPSF